MVTTVLLVAHVMLMTRPEPCPAMVLYPGFCFVKLAFQPPDSVIPLEMDRFSR